ncbi:MAG: hypothetical protein H6744_17085 [Deltaproteobacteria bacterium]|nr:hypothetical protein [Deltaproteobacteria bacterium]
MLAAAAALVLARRGENAAAVLEAWRTRGLRGEPGLEQLSQAAAAWALRGALDELGPALRSGDRRARDEAARALATVRHASVALAEAPELAAGLERLGSDWGAAEPDEVARVIGGVDRALRDLRALLGPGLGEPGCAAVCRALQEVCVARCAGGELECDTALSSCTAGCASAGRVAFGLRLSTADGCP